KGSKLRPIGMLGLSRIRHDRVSLQPLTRRSYQASLHRREGECHKLPWMGRPESPAEAGKDSFWVPRHRELERDSEIIQVTGRKEGRLQKWTEPTGLQRDSFSLDSVSVKRTICSEVMP